MIRYLIRNMGQFNLIGSSRYNIYKIEDNTEILVAIIITSEEDMEVVATDYISENKLDGVMVEIDSASQWV